MGIYKYINLKTIFDLYIIYFRSWSWFRPSARPSELRKTYIGDIFWTFSYIYKVRDGTLDISDFWLIYIYYIWSYTDNHCATVFTDFFIFFIFWFQKQQWLAYSIRVCLRVQYMLEHLVNSRVHQFKHQVLVWRRSIYIQKMVSCPGWVGMEWLNSNLSWVIAML